MTEHRRASFSFHASASRAGGRSRAASAFIWLFVLALGEVMMAGGFYMRRDAQATRAEVVREGRMMDRRWDRRLTRRHRDGTCAVCFGVLSTALGAFGVVTVLSGRRMPREDQVAESLFFRLSE